MGVTRRHPLLRKVAKVIAARQSFAPDGRFDVQAQAALLMVSEEMFRKHWPLAGWYLRNIAEGRVTTYEHKDEWQSSDDS